MVQIINHLGLLLQYSMRDTPEKMYHQAGHTQYLEKNNVWAGILGDAILGPLFLNENLTGEVYLSMLEVAINPLITDEVEIQKDEFGNAIIIEELTFNEEEAPPHYARTVRVSSTTEFHRGG